MVGVKPTQLGRVARVRALAAGGDARTIREAAGISLREAALAIKTSPSTLSRCELGECRPGPELALRWGVLLDQLAAASTAQAERAVA